MARGKRSRGPNSTKTLHQRAEEVVGRSPTDIAGMSSNEMQLLIYELQLHQIELELQNEELRQAHVDLAQSRDQYSDLYEFAPTGYVTLDSDSKIQNANLRAATMLGVERQHLLQSRLSDFVIQESQDDFYLHLQTVFSSETNQICEVGIKGVESSELVIRLESIAFGPENDRRCHTALIDLTAERQAQRQILESEQRYRRLTGAVTDCNYRVRVEHDRPVEIIHGANCEAMTGYTPQEFAANRNLRMTMVPPKDRAAIEQQTACILSGQEAPAIEHRIRRKDGQIIWVLNAVSPERDSQGQLIAYDGMIRDITKRKVAEETLRLINIDLGKSLADRTGELHQNIQRVKLLTEAVSHLGEGVLITSNKLDWPGPHILFANEAMCRITGYSVEELIGQSPRVLQGNNSSRETLDRIKAELTAGRSVLAEVINHRKDGTPYDAELFITPLIDADGRRTNFVSIHRDITERKRAENLLRQERNRAQQYLDVVGVIMVALDSRGNITLINRKGCEVLGYDEHELLGKSWIDTCLPEGCRSDVRNIFQQIINGTTANFEYFENPVLTRTNEERIIEWHNSEIRDETGRIVGVLSSGNDITGRRQAEEDLRASEEQSQAILASLPAHIAVIDRRGTVTAINPAWEAFALANGGSAERCNVGANYLDACRSATEEEGVEVAQKLQAILDGAATSFTMEYPCHSSTQQRWFLLQAVPLRHEKGGAVVTHTNITDRIEGENALRAAHQKLEAVVETAPSLIVVTDRVGRIVHFNRAGEEVTGYRRDEVLGDTVLDRFVPAGWRPEVAARFADPHDPELREPHENPWLTRAGDERLIEWRCLTLPQLDETSPWFLVAFGIDVTERNRAEVALRESEARLAILIDALPVGVGIFDADGIVVVANREMTRYLPTGVIPFRDPDRVGRWRATHPDGRPVDRADYACARAMRGERVVPGIEFRYTQDDGTEMWTQVAAVPLQIADRIPGQVMVISDIDVAKRAEERLALQARQQAGIAALGQKALIGESLQDLMDEAVRTVSDTLQNELVKVLELIPGDDRLLLRAGVGWKEGRIGAATVSAGLESQAGYTLLSSEPVIVADLAAETRFDGPSLLTEHGVVSGMSCTILGTGGEPYGVLGTHTRSRREFTPDDVAFLAGIANVLGTVIQRRLLEESRRASEERMRAILKTAADAIITIDRRGIIIAVNLATETMFGYTQDELLGQNVKILMPQPYRDEHDGYLQHYLKTAEARIIGIGREVVGRRKDGSSFPIGLAVSEVDHLGLFTGIVRDISERHKLQRDVVAIAEDEQRRIGQDLHDSTQQELAGLGMLAQTLLSNLTHEFGEQPKASAANEKCCDLATKILEGLTRAHHELQSISRGLVPIRLDPRGLMDALRELAARTDDLHGITCAFKCEQPAEVAESFTATHLYRIAQEAITNALKHARAEHILIALESESGQPILQVADDGAGFNLSDRNEGMGLKTMQYRASLIGANLTISPIDTGGTLVTCKVFGGGGDVQ